MSIVCLKHWKVFISLDVCSGGSLSDVTHIQPDALRLSETLFISKMSKSYGVKYQIMRKQLFIF